MRQRVDHTRLGHQQDRTRVNDYQVVSLLQHAEQRVESAAAEQIARRMHAIGQRQNVKAGWVVRLDSVCEAGFAEQVFEQAGLGFHA